MNELAPGSMSLEADDQPEDRPTETPAAPEAPAQAPETPQQAADPDPDGTIEGSGGVKFVPLGAVVDLRGKVREKDTELERTKAELEQAKAKAAQLDQIRGEWDAIQPLIQQVKNGTYQPPQQSKPQISPETLQYAKDLDLYKPDGTPDVERAQRILDRQAALAQEQAQRLVQPIYQNTAQQQSAANFEAAASFKDKSGFQVDRGILQNLWSMLPAELTSQPGVAGVVYKLAKAETLDAGKWKPPTQAPPPPQFTESLGGGAPAPRELSHQERQMMSAAGIKTKDYESISANFKPGQANSLE